MPEMFYNHPGHLDVRHCRFLIADCRLVLLGVVVANKKSIPFGALNVLSIGNWQSAIGNAFNYLEGDGLGAAGLTGVP